MITVIILLIFGKMQEYYADRSATWMWAAAFAVVISLFSLAGGIFAALISGAISGLYAWAYFFLLRRFTDNLPVWILIYAAGAILPLLLVFSRVA
ncbi:hypothetical protein HHC19_01810 [Neisseria meningitidis]|uniref:hypothetical protein n=1 Tax=Neisseria meningitidis TaxID=487 RepID=UPI001C55F699|nr:hypothetical protein [Neisseria meningitidis]MBW3885380.1 hypothetical protein [Neisseria meningitidis]